MDRRTLLEAALASLVGAAVAPAAAAQGQTAPAAAASSSKSLAVHPLDGPFAGWQGTMLEVTYPVGATSAAHRHPGPVFGYIVSGKFRWAINGEAPKDLGPGDVFFEPLGAVHSTAANAGNEPAKIMVVVLGKPGDPITTRVPGE
jgi:quercetin dioxygenase-like cupin family protein